MAKEKNPALCSCLHTHGVSSFPPHFNASQLLFYCNKQSCCQHRRRYSDPDPAGRCGGSTEIVGHRTRLRRKISAFFRAEALCPAVSLKSGRNHPLVCRLISSRDCSLRLRRQTAVLRKPGIVRTVLYIESGVRDRTPLNHMQSYAASACAATVSSVWVMMTCCVSAFQFTVAPNVSAIKRIGT